MIADRKHKHSGQAQIMSAMLVFSIGIVVLAGLTLLFQSMKNNVVQDFQNSAAKEVLDYFAIRASGIMEANVTYASVAFPIPAKIGGKTYIVSGDGGNAIYLATYDFSIDVTSPVSTVGLVDSSSGQAQLIYEGGILTIRGVG